MSDVLGQIDAAHAAGAQQAQQLVFAQEEALVAAFQQLVGVPAGNQAGLDQRLGDGLGIVDGLSGAPLLRSTIARWSCSRSTNPLRRTMSNH